MTAFAEHFITHHAYFTLAVAMLLEGLGLPLPAELLFVPAGFLVSSHDLNLLRLILSGTVGAVAGNLLGYAVGRWGGRQFLLRYGSYFRLNESNLDQVSGWFSQYGAKTIFASRFVGPIRAAAILSAGVGRMPLAEFAAYQFLAALVWNALWAVAAWRLGRRVGHLVHHFGMTATLVLTVLTLLALIVVIYRRPKDDRRG